MNSSDPLAMFLARMDKTAISALPHAPVVPEEEPRPEAWVSIRERLATALHRFAWLVEPKKRF
jgi:hypothetical protein